ncbi:MAG: DUF302 domain-containing protein [Prolixibacteraceae bacterium]|nr:DUF302 domain-containing protein [Prolixibacteraceae bacterium]
MKNHTNMFLTGLLSGILLTILAAIWILPKILFIESESKYSFEETASLISSGTTENGWAMPHQYDLQATMKKHGFEVRPVIVFSVCSPVLANQILGSNDDRVVSAMMPCRISIYQKNDGKTYISRMNAGLFSKLMGGKIKKVMTEAGAGSEQILKPIIVN